jgi:hypothetical protein
MDPGPTISRPYTRHKWVGRMICSQANVSVHAQDLLRLPESMTIIKNRTNNLRFSFPLLLCSYFTLDHLNMLLDPCLPVSVISVLSTIRQD